MKAIWLNKEEYPFHPHYFEVNGEKMHYIDEGEGEVILFVHGTPSWSFEYRNIIKALRNEYRCIAIDHIGFGRSSKPGEYDYSTKNHSRTLEKFIDYKRLKDITLVVHDFGGPIGLSAAINHPGKIKRIIVLNSWLWSNANDPEFARFSKMLKNPLLPFLYRWLNFSPRYLLPGSFGDKKLPKHLLSQYTRPFAMRSQRNGPLAFAHSLLNDQDWFEELWKKRHAISDKPSLFIWGLKDRFISQKHLDIFLKAFPFSQSRILPGCGHFPQEEEPRQVSYFIQEFLEERTAVTLT